MIQPSTEFDFMIILSRWNIPLHIKTPTGEKTCIYYYSKDNTEFTQVMEQAKKEQWFMINSNMVLMIQPVR